MSATLVFPSSTSAALDYVRDAAARGERVVGASSLPGDENKHVFPVWEWLPSIHEPAFPEALTALVARYDLTHVYAPLTTAHGAIKTLIDEGRLSLQLVRPNPIDEQNILIRRILERAETLQAFISDVVHTAAYPQLPREQLPLTWIAATLNYASGCYGECSDTKLAAMLATAASAPEGDIVEVGTLMGKSAAVLVLAAQFLNKGPVLTVDPWTSTHAKQNDSPELIRNLVDLWNFDLLSQGYFTNMIPIAGGGRANHLRLPSDEAISVYEHRGKVETPELGLTVYAGHIGLLHIDANHDVDSVRKDWKNWGPHVVPGGWIVLDDYCWHHGTGPRVVGDDILAGTGLENWDRAFVCGGALFIRLAGAPGQDTNAT